MKKMLPSIHTGLLIILSVVLLLSCSRQDHRSNPIPEVMDRVIRKIYEDGVVEHFANIDQYNVLNYFQEEELKVLSSAYWVFDVDSDVEVFVCRDVQQKEVPFWLIRDGFEKTKLIVENEHVQYEVWSKVFPKGRVHLGINGFDRHRFVYFVAVKPVVEDTKLEINAVWPKEQVVLPMQKGSFTYSDWDELVLTSVAGELEGAALLPTFRGRSREAHLINAFRKTDYPSSLEADQILLTWTDDPKTTQTISWRTNMEIESCTLMYWERGADDTLKRHAEHEVISDALLANDPDVKRFSITLKDLRAGTGYEYCILSDTQQSPVFTFKTDAGSDRFEFGWFGDVHNDLTWGGLLRYWDQMFPNTSFYLQAGDLVNTGLYRDHWDQLWYAAKPLTNKKAFMAVPGNHDSQEGLFPAMYLDYLKYPHNGPNDAPKGLSYNFVYGNTLFLMLNVVGMSVDSQKEWLDSTLAKSQETFKIAVFHFPPFAPESDYKDIVEHWVPLFEKYQVDLVFNGHFHYYLRKKAPGKSDGPIYIMSVGTKEKQHKNMPISHSEKWAHTGYLYQQVKIDGNTLELVSVDSLGSQVDQLKITKNQ